MVQDVAILMFAVNLLAWMQWMHQDVYSAWQFMAVFHARHLLEFQMCKHYLQELERSSVMLEMV